MTPKDFPQHIAGNSFSPFPCINEKLPVCVPSVSRLLVDPERFLGDEEKIAHPTCTDVPADVQELMDAYAEAWNETDGEAAVALMTPGARFYASMMVPDGGYAGDDLVAHINGLRGDAITTGSTTVIGDDP